MKTALLHTSDLGVRKLTALRRKAKRLGTTPEEYIKQLIEDDLALDEQAKKMSWEQITSPFQRAMAGMSEDDIDDLVDRARRATSTESEMDVHDHAGK